MSPGGASDTSLSGDPQEPVSTSDITNLDHDGDDSAPRRTPGALPTRLPDRYAGTFATYRAHVTRPGTPLSPKTVTAYLSRIRQYLAWLEAGALNGDPLIDPATRDWAARDYRAYLLTVAKRSPATVNAHLTAVDDFNRRIGVGPASAKRTALPQLAPRALDQRAQTRFLREAERAPARAAAIAYTGFYAGLRIAELAALDVDDVHLSARKGMLIVRYGKNGRYREVPVHSHLRAALETWMAQRTPAAEEVALFVNARGRRLTTRGIYDILTGLADAAGVEDFTPHVLRHTLGTNLRRQGEDIVVIAELLGHSIETARRYTLPSEDERRAAIENLPTDE
ncbi:tyrosine-type recombinase/integrase [Streptosporangium sp. NPDC002544]|uniref:tyrosine-type recombinase/integrase n=1 Tax=Streptosporangium sp. NPDC002544 TaxID=3154538 RepID=UPI003332330C